MKKKDKSELAAGFIEGMVTTSVLLTLAMLTFGVELFIALIPIIIVLSIAALSVVVFLGFIFCGKVVDDVESAYQEGAYKGNIHLEGGRSSWRTSRED